MVNPKVQRVVACTTRKPREGEVDGVDYHFVSVDTFNKMVANHEFLEWKQVHGNYYATPVKEVQQLLEEGKIAILKIDVQGALAVMKLRPDALSIFIKPPSWDELERRIRLRALDDQEAILKRLRNAEEELAQADHYRFVTTNDILERTVDQLESFIRVDEVTPSSALS